MGRLVLFLTVLLCVFNAVHAQEERKKTTLQLGFSVPELIHAGVGAYLNENTSINLKIGTIADSFYPFLNTFTITSDFCFYFGKVNEKRGVKRWAYNPGITYMKDETRTRKWKYVYLNNSISYDVFLSKRIILQPEIGISIELMEKVTKKANYIPGWFSNLNIDTPVLPKIGVRLKYIL